MSLKTNIEDSKSTDLCVTVENKTLTMVVTGSIL